ncbi:MAG: NB-ARC domain-containing protein [Snowella sp.]|nr:NB-ARC domain-containing protein [Snowella sp.]
MDIQTALVWLEKTLAPQSLNKIQRLVLEETLKGSSYKVMADQHNYAEGYLKDTGSQLWEMLSKAIGQPINKQNLRGFLYQVELETESQKRVDWGDAIDVSFFYGREQERELLTQWIIRDRCRLVGIFAFGGTGKTSLSVKIAQELEAQFDAIFWRSLRDAPPLSELLPTLLKFLAQDLNFKVPDTLSEQTKSLIQFLQKQKTLIVLDNFDALFSVNKKASHYRADYENYGDWLTQLGEVIHQSCILLTSREKPVEITALEGDRLPVRSLNLKGLDYNSGQILLQNKGLVLSLENAQKIIDRYQGNPLALKITATAVQNLLGADIQSIVSEQVAVFTGISSLIDKQIQRLSHLEKSLMFWIAINRDPITLEDLKQDIFPSITLSTLLETLESLQRRSLVEGSQLGITQQPVIMEFVTEQFIQQISQEIITKKLDFLRTHSLIKATSKDYIRESQSRVILIPIINNLFLHFDTQSAIQNHLTHLIQVLQTHYRTESNYAAGNLFNLLRQLKIDLTNYDFSQLTLRQAYLQDTNLPGVNFSDSELKDCVLAETFGGITCVTFSQDGAWLATSDTNGELQIWDSRNFQQLTRCQGHIHWVWSVCFSRDRALLASGGQDQTVRLWDTYTGQSLQVLTGHQGIVTSVAMSPDDQMLASSSQDQTVKLWKLKTGECWQTLAGHQGCVWSVKFSPDGQTVFTASEDGTVKQWQVATGKCLQTFTGHDYWVWSVAVSPDGQYLASSSFDRTIRLWDLVSGECVQILRGHTQPITAIAFSPEGKRLASASYDQTVRLWEIPTGDCQQILAKHSSRVWSVAFHPDGQRLVSGGDDHATCIWQLRSGDCVKTIKGHSNCVYSLALSPDGKTLATAHESQVINLWDVQDPQVPPHLLQTLRGHHNRIFSVIFSLDGEMVISSSGDRTIKIWQRSTGRCLQTLEGHQSWVWSVAISPNGQTLASGSYDHTIKLWDLASGKNIATLLGHPSSILVVKFSPDGRILASGGYDQVIKLWDLETQTCCQTLNAHGNRVWSLDFSPSGDYLATAGDDGILKLWDWQTGECLQTLKSHSSQVLTVRFLDTEHLLSCSGDNTIKYWQLSTGECLATFTGHENWVWSIQPHPDQVRLFSGSNDEMIKVWNLTENNCQHSVRMSRPYENLMIRNIRGLTDAQRATLLALGAKEK